MKRRNHVDCCVPVHDGTCPLVGTSRRTDVTGDLNAVATERGVRAGKMEPAQDVMQVDGVAGGPRVGEYPADLLELAADVAMVPGVPR